MKRPSKKEIQEKIAKLKEPGPGGPQHTEQYVPKPHESKKGNQGKIRKKGV